MAIVKDIFTPLPHPDDPAAIYLRVLCLVFHGERVLLIFQPGSSGAGWWNFPGGRVERGEDPLDTAQRELFEETGLRADLEFRGVATTIVRSTGEHWSMFLFAARVDRADIVPSSEGPLRWAAPAELEALPVFPDAPYLLKHLRDLSGGVVLAKFIYAERDPGSLEVASIRISVYGRR